VCKSASLNGVSLTSIRHQSWPLKEPKVLSTHFHTTYKSMLQESVSLISGTPVSVIFVPETKGN